MTAETPEETPPVRRRARGPCPGWTAEWRGDDSRNDLGTCGGRCRWAVPGLISDVTVTCEVVKWIYYVWSVP